MPVTFTLAQIEHLKLRAKFISRSNSISHSVALDQLAHENGFSNWSLLMKHAAPGDEIQLPSKYLRFTRTPEEMRSALRTVPETRYNFNSPPVSDYLSGNSISLIGSLSRSGHGLGSGV
jgi:hypothetical protein